MTPNGTHRPLFEGLVYNEAGELAEIAYVGGEAQYVILDASFRRHVSAADVDRQVLRIIQEQVSAHQDMVTKSAMEMLGQDDLFTKAAIDASIRNMEELVDQEIPDDARNWLGLMGFRIVVDVHGEVVDISSPGQPIDED
jgi:hypothetical protein